MMNKYQVCSRCVMDTTASDIVFDENGVCNYCKSYEKKLHENSHRVQNMQAHCDEFIRQVKASGKGKDYDCIIGVSGGVDSSYALYLAVKHGLRPLAVHLDNGWNSELATHNISNLIEILGVDLYTHVIDWKEYRDLQRSFFKANVIDIELLMDNAMIALNYQQAAKYRLKYILSGTNMATEGMDMPPGWNHFKYDARNIRKIHKQFGSVPIKTQLQFSVMDWVRYEYICRIKWISFLDYFPYIKADAQELLQKECGYKPYPYKHYESVFTRFYQGYILPHKFGIDKRKLHLSTLIISGQITREEAIQELQCPPYSNPHQREQDRLFVIKKLGFSEEKFNEYINTAEVPHEYFGSEKCLWDALVKAYKLISFKT